MALQDSPTAVILVDVHVVCPAREALVSLAMVVQATYVRVLVYLRFVTSSTARL